MQNFRMFFGEGEDGLSETPLFGGALRMSIPSSFVDISTLREIPDHQEAFSDKSSDRSLVVEVLQRVTDEDTQQFTTPACYFFHDLAEANDAAEEGQSCVLGQLDNIKCPLLQGTGDNAVNPGIVELFACVGRQCVSKFKEDGRNEVLIFLLNVRYVDSCWCM